MPDRRIILLLVIVVAVLTLVTGSSALATDSAVLNQAIDDYNSKEYRAALKKLQSLPKNGPGSDKAQYYLGLCYQATNQIEMATASYTSVFRNSQDSTLRYNSVVALQALHKWKQHRKYEGYGDNFSRVTRRRG